MKIYKNNYNESFNLDAMGSKLETLIFIHFHTLLYYWKGMQMNEHERKIIKKLWNESFEFGALAMLGKTVLFMHGVGEFTAFTNSD